MQRCLLVLSNDTGPMHLAYAFGCRWWRCSATVIFPTAGIRPATDKIPYCALSNIPCAICLRETCADNICMKAIAPGEVISVVDRIIAALLTGETSNPTNK